MKKILSIILMTAMMFGQSFSVIAEEQPQGASEWAREYINKAKEIQLITSESEKFTEYITREHFCEIIYNLINIIHDDIRFTEALPDVFEDTDNQVVMFLNKLDIIEGKSETQFAPNDFLTREEAATIIIRTVSKVAPQMPITEMYFDFDDAEDISVWASSSVQYVCNMGVMNGVGDNKFAPKDKYTVEQAITTLVRVYNRCNINVLEFTDKDGNVILTEDNVKSCASVESDGGDYVIKLIIDDEGREKFRIATNKIAQYPDGENYISVMVEWNAISAPKILQEIDSNEIMITGAFTAEAANEFVEIINNSLNKSHSINEIIGSADESTGIVVTDNN